MPQLICLVQRCNLADGRLIRENEVFEVSQTEAENLGLRIAKPVEKPVVVPKPEPVKESIPAKIVEKQPEPKPEYTQTYEPDPEPGQKTDKRRKR